MIRRKYLAIFTGLLILGLYLPAPGWSKKSYFDRQADKQIKLLKENADKPEGLLDLYFLYDLINYAQDQDKIYDALISVLDSEKAPPLLKSEILYKLSLLDGRRGNLTAAREKQWGLGLVTQWLVIGPFDNEGKTGFDIEYPPEKEIDLNASYDGKERPVKWKTYPPIADNGYISFDTIFFPDTDGVVYALVYLNNPRARDVALRFGADDSIKIWLNGELLHENKDCHPAAFDQAAVGTRLRKGLNRILFKICQTDNRWGFYFRITAPDGEPLGDIAYSADPAIIKRIPEDTFSKEASKAAGRTVEVEDYTRAYKRLVDQNSEDGKNHYLLGLLYNRKKNFDSEQKIDVNQLKQAVKLSPDNYLYHYRLGLVDNDRNSKRESFERTLELEPTFAPAHGRLGSYYTTYNIPRKALDHFQQTLKLDSSLFIASIGLANYYIANAQSAKGAEIIADLLKKYPGTPNLYFYDLTHPVFPISDNDLIAKCNNYLLFDYSSVSVRQLLTGIYLRQFKYDLVHEQLENILETRPSETSVYIKAADIWTDLEEFDYAIEALTAYLEISPEDAYALERLGNCYYQTDNLEKAFDTWQKALEIRPQNPDLKEYVELLQPKARPFEDAYAYEVQELITRAPATGDLPGNSAVRLLKLEVNEVHPNGLSNSFYQNVVKVLTKKGIDDLQYQSVSFVPGMEEIKVQSAKIYKTDGSIINAAGPYMRTIQNPQGGLYYNYQAQIYHYPNLEVGDVLEFRYRKSATAVENLYADYFGDVMYFQSNLPYKIIKYVVITPEEKKFYYHVDKMSVEPVIEVSDGKRIYTWEQRDVDKIESEPRMPGTVEVVPYVHISTFQDWRDMGKWYWGLVQDQFTLNKEACEIVKEIVADSKTELEKITALYEYVVRNTRYIGLEFGIHGHKPYKAYQVFTRKYGDCKDKACLLNSMLKEVGVEADIAIVRTRSKGKIKPEPASLAIFNHAISYIPKYDLWLDTTAEYSGSRELPSEDQGTLAMLVNKDKVEMKQITTLPPEHTASNYDLQAVMNPEGNLNFDAKREIIGSIASFYRSNYEDKSLQQKRLEQAWRAALPDINVDSVEFTDLNDIERNVEFSFSADVPRYALKRNDIELAFSPFVKPNNFTKNFCTLAERKYDLKINYTYSLNYKIKIELPAGYKLETLPEDYRIDNPYIEAELTYQSENNVVSAESVIKVKQLQVPQPDYAEMREVCRAIDEHQTRKIILKQQ